MYEALEIIFTVIMFLILFLFVVPLCTALSYYLEKFGINEKEGSTPLSERLGDRLDLLNAPQPDLIGGFKGLLVLGFSVVLSLVVFAVLLLQGNSWSQLGEMIQENTVIGCVLHITEGFSVAKIAPVAFSVFLFGRMRTWLQETALGIRMLGDVIFMFAAAALAITLDVPIGKFAVWAVGAVKSLFHWGSGNTLVTILKIIPAILVGFFALRIIALAASEFFGSFASFLLGLFLMTLLALIPSLFGLKIMDVLETQALLLLILASELIKANLPSVYEFLSDKLTFLPDLDWD